MGVQLDGQLGILLHGCNQLGSLIGNQQSRHILDTDGIGTHLLDLFRHIRPILQRIGIAQSVGQSNLCMAPALLLLHPVGGVNRLLQIGQIVQTVKDTDDINAVGNGLLYESVHHIVCIGSVTQDVLTAEQHLQLGFLKAVTKFTQSVPGIFLQESQGCVKGRAAPALHRMITDLIHLIHDGQHEISGHPGSNQRLVSITQYGFRYFNRFFSLF